MDTNANSGVRELQEHESLAQIDFPPKSVIVRENTRLKQLIIIHSGEIALFDPRRNTYISILPSNNVVVGFSFLLMNQETPYRIITTKASKISAFPVTREKGIQGLILNKLNIGIMAIISLYKETNLLLNNLNKLQNHYKNLKNLLILMSLSYYKLQPDIVNNLKDLENCVDKNLVFIKKQVDRLIETSFHIPDIITRNWLEQNYRKELDLDLESNVETITFEFDFLKRFSTLNVQLLENIFKSDLYLLEMLVKKYFNIQLAILKDIHKISYSVIDEIVLLNDENYSFFEKFAILIDLFKKGELNTSEKEIFDILSFLQEKSNEIFTNHQKIFLKKNELSSAQSKINQELQEMKNNVQSQSNQVEIEEEKIEMGNDNDSIISDLKESIQKVLTYAEVSKEETQLFTKNMEALRKVNNPLDSDPEIRKLKRPVMDIFWKAYEKCFLKFHYARGNIPKYVQLFLYFGYIDENFLERGQIIQLYNLSDPTKSIIKDLSILNSIEWLNLTAEKKELPSITELGESYFDTIKAANPSAKYKKLSEVPSNIDSVERRVNHEVKYFVSTNSKLTSGSPVTYFPVLTKFHITNPKLEALFLTKENVSKKLGDLIDIDYSAFYREIVLNDEKKKIFKEFVMVNVLPHLILVPSIGSKAMMWQELEDPRKKESRSRIALPILCTGDLFTMLSEAVGAFRWEIQKTILGHEYNNIGIPSLTSEFIDYIQFYQKNRELSDEQKEKIKQNFRNLRDDRSKFVNDYLIWLKYESQGILKLNKVVRNIMYRYVPFSKKIRDNLSKQPAYAEIHNRFKNIRTKKLMELENRWKKYGDKSTWPDSLKTTLEYYSI